MCDFCRNARAAINRTELELLPIAYQTIKQHYELTPSADATQQIARWA
jgi:hypothetical protein